MGSVCSQLQDMFRLVNQRFKKVDEELYRLGKLDSKSRRQSITDVLTGKNYSVGLFLFSRYRKCLYYISCIISLHNHS